MPGWAAGSAAGWRHMCRELKVTFHTSVWARIHTAAWTRASRVPTVAQAWCSLWRPCRLMGKPASHETTMLTTTSVCGGTMQACGAASEADPQQADLTNRPHPPSLLSTGLR